jgi:uncharacterized protein involved in propanediol utilization
VPHTDSFEAFREQLSSQVRRAKGMGASQQDIVAGADHIGDWLVREVDPKNPEQRLLKEMWQVSDPTEQRALASTLVKMVQHTER